MNTYNITIRFKKGPDFSVQLPATNAEASKKDALTLARQSGYNGAVKKVDIELIRMDQ